MESGLYWPRYLKSFLISPILEDSLNEQVQKSRSQEQYLKVFIGPDE